MHFTFSPMCDADLRSIATWSYKEPYSIYNMVLGEDADLAEFFEPRSPYYSVRNEQGELYGFFNYGTSALVQTSLEPGLYVEQHVLPVGLGLRPDLTSKGFGSAFVEAGLVFALQQFAPKQFLLFVLSWNERAIRVYERLGFRRIKLLKVQNRHGERKFLEMRREVQADSAENLSK